MSRPYWDGVAADYERSVLSVFEHDTAGLVRARIAAAGAARPAGRAADLGCGVGKFIPALAAVFAHVEASDFSAPGVAAARAHCAELANVTFRQLDLANDTVPFAPVDFVLCVNVLLMASPDDRLHAWRAVTNQVAHGGTLLLVVPSLESVLFDHFQAFDACLSAGDSGAEAVQRNAPTDAAPADVHQGVHRLSGRRTKHYLREELEQMLPGHEFDVIEIVKLAYAADPTTGAPASWDWLVTARRR